MRHGIRWDQFNNKHIRCACNLCITLDEIEATQINDAKIRQLKQADAFDAHMRAGNKVFNVILWVVVAACIGIIVGLT